MHLTQLQKKQKIIHFVGIGGIGMSGIAKILNAQGFIIQGSDIIENQNTKALKKLGIKIFIGHDAKNIYQASLIIKSRAINVDNPELIYANEQKLKVLSRTDILKLILNESFNIAITGAHGKTSTTALTYYMLQQLQPSLICGGILNKLNNHAVFNKKDFFIVEADESDATFLNIPTNISIITNIDNEHLDFYGTIDNILSSFRHHVKNILKNGLVIICIDCKHTAKIYAEFSSHQNCISYSLHNKNSDIYPRNVKYLNNMSNFDLNLSGKAQSTIAYKKSIIEGFIFNLNADHEISNVLPVIFLGLYFKLNLKQINSKMQGDLGVARRFSVLKIHNNITYVDDYAHHPKEIMATLQKTKKLISQYAKIIVVFQPHKYSRFKDLYQEFINICKNLSHLIVLDVYAAGEKPIPNINSKKFVADLQNKFNNNVNYVQNIPEIMKLITDFASPYDYVLFIGAGDISNLAHQIVKKITA